MQMCNVSAKPLGNREPVSASSSFSKVCSKPQPLAEAGTGNVADYRIYEFTVGRQIAAMRVIACISDAEAIERAREMLEGRDLEVRQGARLIIQLRSKAGDEPSQSPTEKPIFKTLHRTA
jgi:hypothetical protein